VNFKDTESAKKALEDLQRSLVPESGSFLIVNYIVPKETEQYQNLIRQNIASTFASNVYVKNIPKDVTEEELRQQFSNFDVHIHIKEGEQKKTIVEKPKIVSVSLKEAKSFEGKHESKFAFIMYEKVEAAQRAIQIFNGSFPFGGSVALFVEFWMSKDEKEKERKRKED